MIQNPRPLIVPYARSGCAWGIAVVMFVATAFAGAVGAYAGNLVFATAENTDANDTIGVFEVYELTLTHPSDGYANPFQDVSITATFHSPNRRIFTVRGFFYDTNTWKVRFAPDTDGTWTWDLAITTVSDYGTVAGSFIAVPSGGVGFLTSAPANGYRWVRQNGRSFHPIGVQGVNHGGGYLCEDENVPSSTTTNAGVLVDFDYYIDVMTGTAPQMARFEAWSAAGVPTSSSASWTFTPPDEPALFAGLWRGQRWGSRGQQGVSGSHCMAIDLENHNASDHILTAPPITLEPEDLLIFSASSKMSMDAGTVASPADGFAYSVSVQVSADQMNWTTIFTYDQSTVTQYNWGYQSMIVPLQQSGTRWIRWLLPASSVAMPANVQFFFASIDNVRIAQRKPGTGDGINITRQMAQFAGDIVATTSPLTFRINQGKVVDAHRANLKQRHIALIACLNKKLGSAWSWHPLNAANGGPVTDSNDLYSNAAGREITKRCLDYVVARWGAYVDVWEHFNEVYSTDNGLSPSWFQEISDYLRSIDPYQHPICTTYDLPAESWSDLSAPHWYPAGADGAFAATTASFCNPAYGKPIIIDEFGNAGSLGNHTDVRFRTGIWSSFFVGGGLCFWDDQRVAFTTGPAPWNGNANAFVGPELRRYIAYFNRFIAKQPCATLAPHAGTVSDSINLETWGLASHESQTYLFYVHNRLDHSATNAGRTLSFSVVPGTYQAEWFSPHTGELVVATGYTGSSPSLAIPDFTTDLALRFTAGPDTTPPAVLTARAGSQTSIAVEFSEPVLNYDLCRLANFTLDGGAEMLSATPGADGRSVTLLTSLLQPGRTYQLSINNIADLQNPSNRTGITTHPVQFAGTDTVVLGSSSFRDASISLSDANAAGKGNNGGLATMTVSASSRERALVWFPVPASANHRIVSRATLRLYCTALSAANQTIHAHRLTRGWTEGTATWSGGWANGVSWRAHAVDYLSPAVFTEHAWDAPGGDFESSPVASAIVASKFAFIELDLTSTVNAWANGSLPNYGLLLQSPATPAFASASFLALNHYAEPWKSGRVVLEYEGETLRSEVVLTQSPQFHPGGIYEAGHAGVPGWNYSIEAAADLSGPWVPLPAVTADPQGYFVIQDIEAGFYPRRFYRVRTP